MKEINNRKAYYNYNVLESIEAGIELIGTEVKSCSAGSVNISEGYILIDNNEVFLYNTNISCYKFGSWTNHDPIRKKRLLLHKKEIIKLNYIVKTKHCSLIPLKMYENKNGKFKILIGVCSPKKNFDKREKIRNREENINLKRIINCKTN